MPQQNMSEKNTDRRLQVLFPVHRNKLGSCLHLLLPTTRDRTWNGFQRTENITDDITQSGKSLEEVAAVFGDQMASKSVDQIDVEHEKRPEIEFEEARSKV